uniref:Uncharacterized protein n=1 Tax=Phenylobacterium glaciei TaxID=2803784 RepID=A0A974S8J6_9CAUL|nr:hypothetical protein JKL49_02220 [Phenylobacterium glaciei]
MFFLTGLWHGAAWSFIVWGLYHGAFLMLERFGLRRVLEAAPRVLRHAYALLVVMIGWVFFRAADLGAALHYLSVMLDPRAFKPLGLTLRYLLDTEVLLAFAAGIVFAFPTLQVLMTRLKARRSDALAAPAGPPGHAGRPRSADPGAGGGVRDRHRGAGQFDPQPFPLFPVLRGHGKARPRPGLIATILILMAAAFLVRARRRSCRRAASWPGRQPGAGANSTICAVRPTPGWPTVSRPGPI